MPVQQLQFDEQLINYYLPPGTAVLRTRGGPNRCAGPEMEESLKLHNAVTHMHLPGPENFPVRD